MRDVFTYLATNWDGASFIIGVAVTIVIGCVMFLISEAAK